jgi:acetolactate synthase-1/2/3 large subunit
MASQEKVTDIANLAAQAIELLKNAERPVILVGNGVRLSHAVDDFYKLMNILKIPVLATWKTLDMFTDEDEFYIGRPGAVGQRGANFTQQNSDLILILGARLDLGQTGYSHQNFARAAKKIMVDIDENEIKKMNTAIDIPVAADAKLFILEMLKQIKQAELKDTSSWLDRCKEWKCKYPVILPEYREQKEFVNDYYLLEILSEEMNSDDLLIPGSSGACSERTMQAFPMKKGIRVFNSEGLGPMGFGLPAAIGGCIASGKKRTISIDGDGGFVMNIQELETLKRLNLPVKIFLLNNQGYVSIRATQNGYFNGNLVGSSVSSGLTLPDFLKVASSYNIESARIYNHSDLREKVKLALNHAGPFICEVMVDPNMVTSPKITSVQLPNGTIVSKPLEDMWPFLDRDEFNANMIIKPLE